MGTKKKTNITDIQLNISKKEQFRINGDDSKIIELDIQNKNNLRRIFELEEINNKLIKEDEIY